LHRLIVRRGGLKRQLYASRLRSRGTLFKGRACSTAMVVGLQDRRPGGVNIRHQLMVLRVSSIGMVAPGKLLSASTRTARRGERASEGMTATRIQSNGGFHMRVAPLNDLIFNRITIQSDRSMAASGLLRPGTVCRSSCYTFLPRLRPIRSSAVRFAADSPLEGDGFEH
jgi:hypothetical protein